MKIRNFIFEWHPRVYHLAIEHSEWLEIYQASMQASDIKSRLQFETVNK